MNIVITDDLYRLIRKKYFFVHYYVVDKVLFSVAAYYYLE